MEIVWIIVLVFILVLAAFSKEYIDNLDNKDDEEEVAYNYKREKFFMTRAEHEFYDVLREAVSSQYRIFAQVHLSTILDHKVKGQSWQGALAHIDRKSVDFVLCDKNYISPRLVIELDDKTHTRQDRKERDQEVERILEEADLPLLRIENNGNFNPDTLARKIKQVIDGKQDTVNKRG